MLAQVSVAAATAVLGYDLLKDSLFQTSQKSRRIIAGGLAGSAAPIDAKVTIYVGTDKVAELWIAATGAVLRDHMFRIGAFVGVGEKVSAIVDDAPITNAINLALDFAE